MLPGARADCGSLAGCPARAEAPQPLPETVAVEELAAVTDISERVIWKPVTSGEFLRPVDTTAANAVAYRRVAKGPLAEMLAGFCIGTEPSVDRGSSSPLAKAERNSSGCV